jgi:hypothetical protein
VSKLKHPSLFTLPGLAVAAALVYGAFNRVDPEPAAGVPLWTGDSFASLSWFGVVALVLAVLLAWRRAEQVPDALAFAGFGAQLLLFSAGITIALAVSAECQNYWDAYHFSSLAWTFALSALVSLIAVRKAAALGSEFALSLRLPAIASFVLTLVGWTWTWSSTLHALASDVARALFLATHG